MALPMTGVENFLNNLEIERNRKKNESIRDKNLRINELEDLKQKLNNLRDERQHCTETIIKNLTSITASKKSIQKLVEEIPEEVGLPISSICRTKALNFFSNAATLINDSEKHNFYSGADELDATKISESIQSSNKNSLKEITNLKNKLEEIKSVKQCSRLLNDYTPPGFPGEES